MRLGDLRLPRSQVESGKRADRPKLAAALAACRIHGAKLFLLRVEPMSGPTPPLRRINLVGDELYDPIFSYGV
jgi:hypothetical protein